jgi:hypothetical protein
MGQGRENGAGAQVRGYCEASRVSAIGIGRMQWGLTAMASFAFFKATVIFA